MLREFGTQGKLRTVFQGILTALLALVPLIINQDSHVSSTNKFSLTVSKT